MNLDIIDYGCVDWNTLLLVKGKQLNLTDEDMHILMLMMTCHKLNIRPITPQCLSRYSSLALSRIDEIMLKLINGHFVNRCNGQLDFKPIQMKLLDEKEEKRRMLILYPSLKNHLVVLFLLQRLALSMTLNDLAMMMK